MVSTGRLSGFANADQSLSNGDRINQFIIAPMAPVVTVKAGCAETRSWAVVQSVVPRADATGMMIGSSRTTSNGMLSCLPGVLRGRAPLL